MSHLDFGLPAANAGRDAQLWPVRKSLERVAVLDQAVYLVWLQSRLDGSSHLATEAELAAAAATLGRRKTLARIEGHPPGSDPELQLLPRRTGPSVQFRERYPGIPSRTTSFIASMKVSTSPSVV